MDELYFRTDQFFTLEPAPSDAELVDRVRSMFACHHPEGSNEAEFARDFNPADALLVEFIREVRALHTQH